MLLTELSPNGRPKVVVIPQYPQAENGSPMESDMGGKDSWVDEINAIKSQNGFERVTSVGLAMDADADFAASFRKCQGVLSAVGWPIPNAVQELATNGSLTTSVHVVSGGEGQPGSLEEMLFVGLGENAYSACIDALFKCIETNELKPPKYLLKSKLRTFVYSQPTFYQSVPLAIDQGVIDFSLPGFDSVKTWLESFAL